MQERRRATEAFRAKGTFSFRRVARLAQRTIRTMCTLLQASAVRAWHLTTLSHAWVMAFFASFSADWRSMATEPATAHLQLPAAEDVGMSLLRHCFWFFTKSNEQSDQLVMCQPFQTGGVAGWQKSLYWSHWKKKNPHGSWKWRRLMLPILCLLFCSYPSPSGQCQQAQGAFCNQKLQSDFKHQHSLNELGGLEWNRGWNNGGGGRVRA